MTSTSEESHKKINQLLTKLITSQLEISNPSDPKINDVLSYLSRVLNLISAYKTPDESQVKQLLHKQLMRLTDDETSRSSIGNTSSAPKQNTSSVNANALRLQELVTRFARTRAC